MQGILAAGGSFRIQDQTVLVEEYRDALLSWLTECSDRQERRETRDFLLDVAVLLLEVVVIILIGVEIKLGLVQLRDERKLFDEQKTEFSLQEQAQQKTIELLTKAGISLQTLSENVKAQERARIAEQAKKPEFTLCVRSRMGCQAPGPQSEFQSPESFLTGTANGPIATLNLDVRNTGNKDATGTELHMAFESQYSVHCESPALQQDLPSVPESGVKEVILKIGLLRAGGHFPIKCTANQGQHLERITFYMSLAADQGSTGFPSITLLNSRQR